MMTNDDEGGEGGKKSRKYDDVICERPQTNSSELCDKIVDTGMYRHLHA